MKLRGKKVLITGASGFIGSHLLERLLSLDLDIRASIHSKKVRDHLGKIECVYGDLTKKDFCQEVVQDIDIIFMCAANTGGAAVMQSKPLNVVTSDIVMNVRLLEAAYHADVKKIIFLSSVLVYPEIYGRNILEKDAYIGEPYEKYFSLGWMKRYSEILCQMCAEKLPRSMMTAVLRLTNVYGPGDDFNPATSNVLPALIKKVVERQDPLIVWGNGTNIRDLIYIDDVIDAIILATERLDTYQPLNIAFGKGYSVKEILQTILEVAGYGNPNIEFDTSKPSMISVRLLDNSKAKELLGFEPQIDLREGIERTVAWCDDSPP